MRLVFKLGRLRSSPTKCRNSSRIAALPREMNSVLGAAMASNWNRAIRSGGHEENLEIWTTMLGE